MPSGGSRPRAGRKPKATTHARPIAVAEKTLADRLPKTIKNLIALADGGEQEVQEIWVPAGTVMLDDIETEDSPNGPRSRKIKRPAFPHLPPLDLVCLKKTVTTFGPDLKANMYSADRIMGKTTVRIEHDGEVTAAIPKTLESMIEKLYGEADSTQTEADSDADE